MGVVVVVVGRRRSGDALERRASLVRRVIAEGWVGVRGFRMGMGNVEKVCIVEIRRIRRDISPRRHLIPA